MRYAVPVLALLAVLLGGCLSPPETAPGGTSPASSNVQIPSDAFGAYLLSGAQGQAAEELFANQAIQPAVTVWALFGKSRVSISPDGTTVAESEGVERFGDSFTMSPTITFGDVEGGSASSGGGGTAGTQAGGGQ